MIVTDRFIRKTLANVNVGDLIAFTGDEVGRRVDFRLADGRRVVLSRDGESIVSRGANTKVFVLDERNRGRGRPPKTVQFVV